MRLYVWNQYRERDAVGESQIEDDWIRRDAIAQVHLRISKCRGPVRIACQIAKPALESGEIGELSHTDRVECEVDSEGLQRAVGPTRCVHAVALIEPCPVSNEPQPENSPRQHQGVVTDTEHALSVCGWGKNGDESECYCGNADQTTAHRFSARCEQG